VTPRTFSDWLGVTQPLVINSHYKAGHVGANLWLGFASMLGIVTEGCDADWIYPGAKRLQKI